MGRPFRAETMGGKKYFVGTYSQGGADHPQTWCMGKWKHGVFEAFENPADEVGSFDIFGSYTSKKDGGEVCITKQYHGAHAVEYSVAPSLHHHCTITAPSLHHHCTITAPSPHHHCTIT